MKKLTAAEVRQDRINFLENWLNENTAYGNIDDIEYFEELLESLRGEV